MGEQYLQRGRGYRTKDSRGANKVSLLEDVVALELDTVSREGVYVWALDLRIMPTYIVPETYRV